MESFESMELMWLYVKCGVEVGLDCCYFWVGFC